jgi:hypothetical protein
MTVDYVEKPDKNPTGNPIRTKLFKELFAKLEQNT